MKRESLDELKARTRTIIRRLKRAYPDARCSLNHTNPFELLIATILSAQCTDERVNIVTADLFRKYRKPEDYLNVSPRELEKDIQSTGFFRNKTKSIQGASKMLTEEYGWAGAADDGRAVGASGCRAQDCECRVGECF
jgi:endonuclease-3